MIFTTQYINDKFINNLTSVQLNNIYMDVVNIENVLYELFYRKKCTHMLFIESLANNEVLQFIAEFFQTVKIFFYHDKEPNLDLIKTYGTSITHLIKKPIDKQRPNCIHIPKLINSQIFFDNQAPKDDSIICFLDNIPENLIMDYLGDILYPKSKNKIKLFNAPYFKHPQNLGLVSEQDKGLLLQQSRYYLKLTDEYTSEALACNCEILDHNLNTVSIDKNILTTYNSYHNFVEDLVNVK